MIDKKSIDELIKKLSEALPPSFYEAKKDLERNFRQILQSSFAKLDLVTRKEFDVQVGVLKRTRAKLEKLEKEIAELNKKTDKS